MRVAIEQTLRTIPFVIARVIILDEMAQFFLQRQAWKEKNVRESHKMKRTFHYILNDISQKKSKINKSRNERILQAHVT